MVLIKWMRTCISDYNNGSDSNNGSVILVVDGVKLGEEPFFDFDSNVTSKGNFTLHLGKYLMGSMTDVNLFSPALTEEDMTNITNPEGDECGKEGSIFSWRDSLSKTGEKDTEQKSVNWIQHGKAEKKIIPRRDGPCSMPSRVTVFASKFESFFDCVEHCQKLGGRCPSLRTINEINELDLLSWEIYDDFILWLSITQGKMVDNKLVNFDHWPKDVEAGIKVWRDYYTGHELETNFSIHSYPGENCAVLEPFRYEGWRCVSKVYTIWCPCRYHHQPRSLLLRGLCPDSNLRTIDFHRGLWYIVGKTAKAKSC